MNKPSSVTEPHPSLRDFQRATEQTLRFHVIRATDAVPGTKTWRESRARNDRTPFRNELEIARTVMCRAVYTGNAETVKLAGDELWDMALTFSKYVARIIADAKLAVWDDSERVA